MISDRLGEAHMSCQPLKPHREGIRVRIWPKTAYVTPRPRGPMAAAGGSDGSSSSGSSRARRKEGVSCAAAGERDRASAATGVWDRADSSGSSRCTHSVPCIHSPRTMHSFTADPWTEWHRTDMTMHIGKMPGDKQKEPQSHPKTDRAEPGTPQATCGSFMRWVEPDPAGF